MSLNNPQAKGAQIPRHQEPISISCVISCVETGSNSSPSSEGPELSCHRPHESQSILVRAKTVHSKGYICSPWPTCVEEAILTRNIPLICEGCGTLQQHMSEMAGDSTFSPAFSGGRFAVGVPRFLHGRGQNRNALLLRGAPDTKSSLGRRGRAQELPCRPCRPRLGLLTARLIDLHVLEDNAVVFPRSARGHAPAFHPIPLEPSRR